MKNKILTSRNLHFRSQLMEGTFADLKVDMTINVDSKAVFVEFEGCPKVQYLTFDILEYSLLTLKEQGFLDRDFKPTGKWDSKNGGGVEQ